MPLWGGAWGEGWGDPRGGRMQTTTLDALRAAFTEQIRAITPSHTRYDEPWQPVERVEDVPGTELRLFCVEVYDEEPDPNDSIWGDGYTQVAQLQIWTNYSGLKEREPERMISQDGRQLYVNLEGRLDPQIPGLTSVDRGNWADATDDNGNVWGAHVFRIRYLADDTL